MKPNKWRKELNVVKASKSTDSPQSWFDVGTEHLESTKNFCSVIFSKEGRRGEIIGMKLRHECFLILRFGIFF